MRIAFAIATVLVLIAGSAFGSRDWPNGSGVICGFGHRLFGGSLTNFTVSIWVFADAPLGATSRSVLMVSQTGLGKYVYFERASSGSGIRLVHSDGSAIAAGPYTVTTNAWHHVLGRRSSTTSMELWIDGSLVASNTTAQTFSTGWATNFAVGNYTLGDTHPSRNWEGQLAEAAVWTTALTDGEIQALNAGASARTIRPANLAAYAPLYGAGGVSGDEIDVVRGALPRLATATNIAEFPHPRIYR